MDEDESEQEDSSVHSSSVRSDSSGRVKKNKRGRPAKKKKKSRHNLLVKCTIQDIILYDIQCFQFETFLLVHVSVLCLLSFCAFLHHICFHTLQSQVVKRKVTVMRPIIRTTARCVSRAARSSCVTLVPELTTSSALSLSWIRPPRASGAARTAWVQLHENESFPASFEYLSQSYMDKPEC